MGGSRKASGLQRDSLRGGSKGLTQQRITQEPGQDRREREWRGWVWKGRPHSPGWGWGGDRAGQPGPGDSGSPAVPAPAHLHTGLPSPLPASSTPSRRRAHFRQQQSWLVLEVGVCTLLINVHAVFGKH